VSPALLGLEEDRIMGEFAVVATGQAPLHLTAHDHN
jgi:hypothetical protein